MIKAIIAHLLTLTSGLKIAQSDFFTGSTGRLFLIFTIVVSLFIDYYRCQKALDAKGLDTQPCEWYKRVYKSLCPISWVNIRNVTISFLSFFFSFLTEKPLC